MLLKMILNVCCVMLFLSHLKTPKISEAVSESESVSETVRVKQKKDAKACRGGLSRCMISYCQRMPKKYVVLFITMGHSF